MGEFGQLGDGGWGGEEGQSDDWKSSSRFWGGTDGLGEAVGRQVSCLCDSNEETENGGPLRSDSGRTC